MKVCINTINKVKDFCNLTTRQEYDITLISGRYAIDAKSIMGVFSLDLSKNIEIVVDTPGVDMERFKEIFKDFLVE